MNPENDNINKLVKRIVECLDQGTHQIKKSTLNRLESIRNEAMAKHAIKSPTLSLASAGHTDSYFGIHFNYRFWVSIGAFVFCLIALNYYQNNQQSSEVDEITGLLTSDLPIDAYIDQDFDTWLEHSSL